MHFHHIHFYPKSMVEIQVSALLSIYVYFNLLQSILDKVKDVEHKIEKEFNKDVGIVAEKTHMKPW